MNKRIQKLAAQCTSQSNGSTWTLREEFDKEKFAELIVTECLKLLVNGEGNEKTSDAIWDLEELGVDVSKLLDQIRS